jgi:short-subunit dehydrogenase
MRPRLKPIAEQVIVITGASSGIGLVTARAATKRGAQVMLVARNESALCEIAEAIVAAGGSADYAAADVGDHGQLSAAADRAIARFGRIDTWVNCAGVAIYAKLLDTPLEEHERLFRTNYFGVVNGAQIAVKCLRTHGGALITIASIAADIASPIMGAYAASKHAVKGYIESLRLELNADAAPISVTLIKPSGIDTPIGAHAANHVAGEALVPPPAYDPSLVAEAILDAAEHPRLDVTVGGLGRAQVLAATHFPALFARIGGWFAPLLFDPDRPKTPSDNLDRPGDDGRERSMTSDGRRFSAYTAAERHRGAVFFALALAAVGGAALIRRRRAKARNPI